MVRSWHTVLADEICMVRPRHTYLVDRICMVQARHTYLVDRICMVQARHTDLADGICMVQARHTDLVDGICMVQARHTDLVDEICMVRAENKDLVDEICMLRYGMILYLFLLRAILMEIVFWGLRSPQPPLWGAGKSVMPRLFPSGELLPHPVPTLSRRSSPFIPLPLSLTLCNKQI